MHNHIKLCHLLCNHLLGFLQGEQYCKKNDTLLLGYSVSNETPAREFVYCVTKEVDSSFLRRVLWQNIASPRNISPMIVYIWFSESEMLWMRFRRAQLMVIPKRRLFTVLKSKRDTISVLGPKESTLKWTKINFPMKSIFFVLLKYIVQRTYY